MSPFVRQPRLHCIRFVKTFAQIPVAQWPSFDRVRMMACPLNCLLAQLAPLIFFFLITTLSHNMVCPDCWQLLSVVCCDQLDQWQALNVFCFDHLDQWQAMNSNIRAMHWQEGVRGPVCPHFINREVVTTHRFGSNELILLVKTRVQILKYFFLFWSIFSVWCDKCAVKTWHGCQHQ